VKIVVEDDYLDKEQFDGLQTFILSGECGWFWNEDIDYKGAGKDTFQFTHTFYRNNCPCSDHYDKLWAVIEKLNGDNPLRGFSGGIMLSRIKANLLTRTPKIVQNDYHCDLDPSLPDKKLKQLTTSIFYINTNNGFTEFEDGKIVESVANRILSFPTNLQHRGSSCTDEKRRVLINFNYFQPK
tara:strand:+ start:368 stop:916 length:549 start_codon:yes stop_codon:yes gene_type:complete